jgi:4-amino-4-deoxy-L-arabinose transferase-like glycosyltransferase
MSEPSPRSLLPLLRLIWPLLLIYVVSATLMAWRVPPGEAPDELDHFLYVAWLVQERRLPVMSPVTADNVTMEANQPPLTYLVGALLTGWQAWGDHPPVQLAEQTRNPCFRHDSPYRPTFYLHPHPPDPARAGAIRALRQLRLFSVAVGAATLLTTGWIAARVTRHPATQRLLVVTAVSLVAFNPQFVYITASVNNDVPATLLGALILAHAIHQATAPPRRRDFVLTGLLLAAALLTKLSLLALFPVAALGFLLALHRQPAQTRQALLTTGGIVLAGSGWWYLRNAWLYGDPLVWRVHLEAKGPYVLRAEPFTLADLPEMVRIHFQSWWAWFGWLNIQPPDFVYLLILLVCLVAATGWVRLMWRMLPRLWRREWRTEWVVPLFAGLVTAATWAALLRYALTINWSGYQGRLGYAAMAAIAVLLAVGLREWLGRRLFLLIPLWGVGALLVLAGTLDAAWRGAGMPGFDPADGWRPVCAAVEPAWEVEWARATGNPPRPGEPLHFELYGYGELPYPDAVVVLAGFDGHPVTTGNITLERTMRSVIGRGMVPVPADALPQRATLLLDGVPLLPVKIAPAAPPVSRPQVSADVVFGSLIRLRGYDLVRADGALRVTLHWEALGEISADYTRFLHALNAAGDILAQSDNQPEGGRYPTGIWETGEWFVEEIVLRDSADIVRLGTGWYRLHPFSNLLLPDGAPRHEWPLPLLHRQQLPADDTDERRFLLNPHPSASSADALPHHRHVGVGQAELKRPVQPVIAHLGSAVGNIGVSTLRVGIERVRIMAGGQLCDKRPLPQYSHLIVPFQQHKDIAGALVDVERTRQVADSDIVQESTIAQHRHRAILPVRHIGQTGVVVYPNRK